MIHQIVCTNCSATLTSKQGIPEGRQLTCPKCQESFTVRTRNRKTEDSDEFTFNEASPAPKREANDQLDEENRSLPRKKKVQKKNKARKSGALVVWATIGGLGLIAGVALSLWAFGAFGEKRPEQNQTADAAGTSQTKSNPAAAKTARNAAAETPSRRADKEKEGQQPAPTPADKDIIAKPVPAPQPTEKAKQPGPGTIEISEPAAIWTLDDGPEDVEVYFVKWSVKYRFKEGQPNPSTEYYFGAAYAQSDVVGGFARVHVSGANLKSEGVFETQTQWVEKKQPLPKTLKFFAGMVPSNKEPIKTISNEVTCGVQPFPEPPKATPEQQALYARIQARGGLVMRRKDDTESIAHSILIYQVDGKQNPMLPDADIRLIAKIPTIKSLRLDALGLTDAQLLYFKDNPNLTSFSIMHNSTITDAGLQQLTGMAKLRSLLFSATPTTGRGLATVIKNLPGLQQIYTGSQTRDEDLVHLLELPKFKGLSVSDTLVTDAGMETIGKLKDLVFLNISRTKITDAGLKPLKQLTNLRRLPINRLKLTEAGIDDLRKALPQLEIIKQF